MMLRDCTSEMDHIDTELYTTMQGELGQYEFNRNFDYVHTEMRKCLTGELKWEKNGTIYCLLTWFALYFSKF